MLAFSTCWLSHRYDDGYLLTEEMKWHDIRLIEISHGTKVSLLPGIWKGYRDGLVDICGVHNFCPSPVDVMIDAPDAFEFTSHRENERERAILLTLESIDTCSKFGGEYLVIHCGSVPIRQYTRELEVMAIQGEMHSRKWVKLKHEFIKKRREIAPVYLQRVRDAIDRILPYAKEKKIKLAVESRSHYEQVPTEEEMVDLLDDYDSPWLGYWHDFGHVQRKHNLGILNHHQWLKKMRNRLIGGHLHDVEWPKSDHRIPFEGDMKYDDLIPFFSPQIPLVWELNPRRKTAIMKAAWEKWIAIFGGEYISGPEK